MSNPYADFDDYGLRHIAAHLIDIEQWGFVTEFLTDLKFIEAKCTAGMVYDLQVDFRLALNALPEAQKEKEKKSASEQQIAQYTKEMVAYARVWSKAREQYAVDPRKNPMPKDNDIPLPIFASVVPWIDDQIRAESERILQSPTHLNRIRAFSNFLTSESHNLLVSAAIPGFCLQQALNYADSGPVVETAKRILNSDDTKDPMILRSWQQRSTYCPNPALLRTLEGHKGSIWSVDMTPDGKIGISGGDDHTLRVWELDTGRCLHTLTGHHQEILSISMTPDGKIAVSGSKDETLHVWNLITGQCVRTLDALGAYTAGVRITPDANIAISRCENDELHVWDLSIGKCKLALKGHEDRIICADLTPDGKTAISGSRDNTVRVWDLVTGKCIHTLEGHTTWVSCVKLTPDGKTAVSGGGKLLQVWDLISGRCLRTLKGHQGTILGIGLVPDGRFAVSGSADMTVRVWDLASGQCLRTLEGHGDKVESISLSADGRIALSGSKDGLLRVWDLNGYQRSRMSGGHKSSADWVENRNYNYNVNGVSLTMDARIAVSAGADETLRSWDVAAAKSLHVFKGHKYGVNCVNVTPDGRIVISGGEDATIRLWNLEKGNCLRILRGHRQLVTCLRVAIDGRSAVSGSYDESLQVWDLNTGICLRSLDSGNRYGYMREDAIPGFSDDLSTPDSIGAVGLTPDGKIVVSGHLDGTVRVWNLETGQRVNVLERHQSGIRCISVSANGRMAISGTDRDAPRIWDLASGKCLRTLEGSSDRVQSVSISPDNSIAIVGGHERIIRLWDIKSGKCIGVFHPSNGRITVSELRNGVVFGYGTSEGDVVFANLYKFKFGIPIVTATRLWLSNTRGTSGRWLSNMLGIGGKWDDHITALCEHCGRRFEPKSSVIDAIQSICADAYLTSGKAPCLVLPVEAWDEQRLLSVCPHCHKTLQFNPFMVDNRNEDGRSRYAKTPGQMDDVQAMFYTPQNTGAGQAEESLIRALSGMDTQVCLAAIQALRDIDNPKVVKALAKALHHREPCVRLAALQALPYFPTTEDHDVAERIWYEYCCHGGPRPIMYEAYGPQSPLHKPIGRK
jgi:WD40 repeat protein